MIDYTLQNALQHKVAIVTGAGQGIGAAIAEAYTSLGATVVCVGRTQAKLDTVCAHITQQHYPGKVISYAADITVSQQRQAVVAFALEQCGTLTHLVNTVGGGGMKDLASLSDSELNDMFNYNVTSAYHLIQLCVPHMHTAGTGNIINISSAAGKLIQKHFSAYATVKAGLDHLTRNLAQELAPVIRVNAIAPGPIETPALLNFVPAEILQKMADKTPLQRIGTTQDIAQAALFLASAQSSWITGQILAVDGGAENPILP